jgi:outer membrane protein OmpA-like peptidoglycan-associated protein
MRGMHVRVITATFVAVLLIAAFGFTQENAIDKYRSASLDGTSGLFKTWGADTLRQGEFNFSVGYDLTHRDPGQLTVGRGVTAVSFGILERLEAFGSWDYLRHITADNLGYYRTGSLPTPAETPSGSQYFSQVAPFINVPYSNSNANFSFGVKFNLLSERRGDPVSMGIAGIAYIPGRTDVIGLNRGISSGAYGGGFSWLLSKTAGDFAKLHLNVGSNFYSDTEVNGTTLLSPQNEFTYRAGAEFPVNRAFRGIAELSGLHYYGDKVNAAFNPADPVDLILGMKVYPREWMALGAGYQVSLNHVEDEEVPGALGASYNGFVLQAALGLRRNDPPTVSCNAAKRSILQEDSVDVRASAIDPEGDKLTYAWSATGGTISGSGEAVKYEAGNVAPGKYSVKVDVTDEKDHTVSCTTEIDVAKRNYPPTVALQINPQTVTQGETANVRANASDRNNDPLTYSWTVNGEKLAATDPAIVFGSEGRAPGDYTVAVSVSDGEASADASGKITVLRKPNVPPTISCPSAPADVASGQSVALNAAGNDPDGGSITYSWSSSVGRISGSGNSVAFDSTGVKAGSYSVTATVTDDRGGKASCSVQVNVSERLSLANKEKDCGYFSYRSSRVDNCAKAALDELAVRMNNDSQLRANIIGYTDGRYEAASVGDSRAKAVAKYLEGKSVDSSRLTVTNGGGENQVGDIGTSAGRRLNRRVEIELTVR